MVMGLKARGAAWALVGLAVFATQGTADAESLFKATASYNAQHPTPRALFTQPRPRYIGDIVTIVVNERIIQQNQVNSQVSQERTIRDSGTGVLNNAVGVFANKLPVSNGWVGKLTNLLALPSLDGVADENETTTQANQVRNTQVQETVTCQVVEVLPNGNLVVQGHKVNQMAKERIDLYVTGVVNPFFLDGQNRVQSTQVANLQYMVGGNGIISRTQNYGLINKLYRITH